MKIKTHPFLLYPKNQLCMQLFLLLHHLLSGESDIFGLPDFSIFGLWGRKSTLLGIKMGL